MLSFNLRVGDDVWFGLEDQPLDQYQQLIIKSADDEYLTVYTPTEVIDVPFFDKPMDIDLLGVQIAAQPDPAGQGLFSLGMEAPSSVKIMRGRVYRRQLDG